MGRGDAPTDDDGLLSPVEGDMGALLDRYHKNCIMSLSEECLVPGKGHTIHLTEQMLLKGEAKSKGLDMNALGLRRSHLFHGFCRRGGC